MNKIVGIDLGTTYSAIAIVNEYGRPEVLVNREGERITPSVVFFDHDGPIVGEVARRSAVANPFKVVQFVKRQIGDKSWCFCPGGSERYMPEEISAMIIKRLKEDAEILLGTKIKDAVITVPAYFDDSQRKATQDAGSIAGLNVLRIINEPTAAALSYGLNRIDQEQTLLVYDLGGGTFDVTIIRLASSGVRVLATGGSKNLGGCDWDNLLMTHVNEEFQNQGGIDLFDDPMLEQDLREKVEIAKKNFSARNRTNIFISAQGVSTSIAITRKTFEIITSGLLLRTRQIMEAVLDDAGLTWPEVDNILLAGGATRMPAVRSMIEHVSGHKPSIDVNPDEVVALGAAIQGEMLAIANSVDSSPHQHLFPRISIQDVNSHSLGLIALDTDGHELNSVVLPKDTPVCSKINGQYLTTVDQQLQFHVQVTEGEDTDLDYVKIVGEGLVRLPGYPKGTPIEIVFEYDEDGIIHLSVVDTKLDAVLGEFHIERLSNLSKSEVETSRKRIERMRVN